MQPLGKAGGGDGQVQRVVAPGGVVEVDRAGLPVVVQDVVEVQVGVDQPVSCRVLAEAGQDGLDALGCLAEDAPYGRVEGQPGEPAVVPGSCPGEVADVQGRAGEAGRRPESAGVAVQRSQDAAEVGDQPPGGAAGAGTALDPAEPDAAAAGRELRGGYPDAEPGGRDGHAGVAGQRGQPGQLGVELGVAAAAGQAHPDDQALACGGVAAEQVTGRRAHPAQPPRYALLV